MCLEDKNEAKLNKRDVSQANFKGISEEMGKVDCENNLKGLEINEAYNRFYRFMSKFGMNTYH